MFSCEIPSGVVIGALFVLLSTISEGVSLDEKLGAFPTNFCNTVKNNIVFGRGVYVRLDRTPIKFEHQRLRFTYTTTPSRHGRRWAMLA